MSPPAASGSGKHTPSNNTATGDFADFLQAEELKARLAEEQEAEYKRELKAAKNLKKAQQHGGGAVGKGDAGPSGSGVRKTAGGMGDLTGHGIGGRGKPETPEERWRRRHGAQDRGPDYVNDEPTLEQRGYFPGDLLHHGHLDVRTHDLSKAKPSTTTMPSHVKHASTNSSPIMRVERLRPPGICGPVSMSDEEEEMEVMANGSALLGDGSLGQPASSPTEGAEKKTKRRRESENTTRPSVDEDRKPSWLRFRSRKSTSNDEAVRQRDSLDVDYEPPLSEEDYDSNDDGDDAASYESSIAEPNHAPPSPVNPSVVSLKSYNSDATGARSLASGGAHGRIARPLLELEELELDSFLKNFGRHTREVRVPHSANFPQRRMPRWEDFRVPPGEAALAAAQGKRVTVLTHVDRGLRALEKEEGEGAALPRVSESKGATKVVEEKEKEKEHHHGLFSRKEKKKDKDAAAPASGSSTPAQHQDTTSSSSLLREKSSSSLQKQKAMQPSASSAASIKASSPAAATPDSAGASTALEARSSGVHPRVSWAPNPTNIGDAAASSSPTKDAKATVQAAASAAVSAVTDYGKQRKQHPPSKRPVSPDVKFGDLGKGDIDKDEKQARKQEKADEMLGGRSNFVNVHDENAEWRPSRDEANLADDEWQLLHHGDEEVLEADDVADDRQVDGIAWAIAYILATIERYAPEELDNSPDQSYRESRTRSHVERLYLIAPFWERLLFGIRRIYRWEDPRRTSTFMMVYFTLWYLNLIPTAFLLCIIYYVCQFRFFPPSASFLHEQVRARMARGVDADRLAERLRRRSRLDVLEIYKRFVIAYGPGTQLACGDVADFHEKVKNLILWRNPKATWRTLILLIITTIFVTFAPAYVLWKTAFAFLGFTFFLLLPLQSHYPRFRRPLSPVWWALWGSPTDAQFAIQLLRRRHLERQIAKQSAAAKNGDIALDNDAEAPTSHSAAQDHNRRAARRATSESGGMSGMFKHKILRPSTAAHAVAYGALRQLKPGGGAGSKLDDDGGGGRWEARNLLDLQDVKVLEGGEILAKPRKLGSFFCQHHGVPGHLHVTTRMLYFVALHSHATSGTRGGRKTCKTLLGDISGLVKTKSIKLLVWNSSGLQITRRNKSSLFFSNMPHRDNAFNLLLAVGSEVWHGH